MNSKIKLLLFSICSVSLQSCNLILPPPSHPSETPSQTGGSELVAGADQYADVSVSPDGTKLAFIRNENICICDTNGKNIVQFSPQGLHVTEAKWSPDGRQIGFVQIDTNDWSHQQFTTMDVASRAVFSKSIGDDFVYGPSGEDYFWDWSPDGQKIGVVCYSTNGGEILKIFKTDGSGDILNSYPADAGPEGVFHWSPDGSQIILTTTINGQKAIYIATIGQSTTTMIIGDTTAYNVSWFPDGNNISYLNGNGFHLYNLSSKHDSLIISYFNYHYQISPDGKYIGYVTSYWDGNPDGTIYHYIACYNLQNNLSGYLISSNSVLTFFWAPSSREIYYTFNGNICKAINSM
jgi:Tol biopolymer transport system component